MPSWLQAVLNACPLSSKFRGDRLPIPQALTQLPYFEKRFKYKYAHLYRAHDERGLKCPMDVRTVEDIVSFCQHVMRSDDIVSSTKDQARVFLARVLNVYNAQNPVPGAMDEDVFDQDGNVRPSTAIESEKGERSDQSTAPNGVNGVNGVASDTTRRSSNVRHSEVVQLEAAARGLTVEQDRRRLRRLERHIATLEARLSMLEPEMDDVESPMTGTRISPMTSAGAGGKTSLDMASGSEYNGGAETREAKLAVRDVPVLRRLPDTPPRL